MITNRIYEWARTQPDKTALIHNDHPCSYAVFARAIEVTKTFFLAQSLPARRTAIVHIGNLADAWIVVLSLRSIGLTTICVGSLETARALNIKDVACIVMTEADKAKRTLREQTFAETRTIVVPKAIYANIHTGDIPRPSNDIQPFAGHILYTSGTTGSYKKVLKDGATEDRRNSRRVEIEGLGRDTVSFVADFALWTSLAFTVSSAVWHAGGCIVSNKSSDALLRHSRLGITRAHLVPEMLKSLLEVRDGSANSAGDFDLRISGGFLPLDLAERARNRLTKNVEVVYGATEYATKLRSLFVTGDDLNWLSPDVERTFEIVDEQGDECPTGTEGVLRVLLHETDPGSYLDDDEATRMFFREGYFYPGDMAIRRANGRIRILGRIADVLNVQGRKLAIGPVEQKVQHFLGVSAVCLFSTLNGESKEELVVAIEASSAPTKSQLDYVARQFEAFERVRFEVLEEFPRTEGGMQKVKRPELRRLIAG